MARYECDVCAYIYDEEKEDTPWDKLPDDWICPDCGVGKDQFTKLDD